MNAKQLLKILIGTAWIDGVIQPQEREHLRQVAEREGLSDDAEIHPLLSELKPVSPKDCYRWIENYLGEHPDESDYQNLLEAIGALIYSDDDVGIQEARLLAKVQSLDPAHKPSPSGLDKWVGQIRELYAKAMADRS